ncbi:hypothetical protein ASF62_11985 [Leifsonia sp. Leaf325]|nr:hypothetical protein [Leifsonia sp. Leaf325]KQQ92566.1 hypothetical protein ASF62_11985 [Leifsonia sp. Leaf325]
MRTHVVRAYATLRRVLIVTLSLAAMIIGLLALHSMATTHTGEPLAAASHTHGADEGGAVTTAPVTAATPSNGVLGSLACDADCAADCMAMAASCLTLFILAILVVLATSPATFAALIDRGRRILAPLARARIHVYFPSLEQLSISRT